MQVTRRLSAQASFSFWVQRVSSHKLFSCPPKVIFLTQTTTDMPLCPHGHHDNSGQQEDSTHFRSEVGVAKGLSGKCGCPHRTETLKNVFMQSNPAVVNAQRRELLTCNTTIRLWSDYGQIKIRLEPSDTPTN